MNRTPASNFIQRHRVFLAAFGALYLLFLYPLLTLKSGFSVGDYQLQFYPWSWAYASALKQGYLLFWTPLIQSGFPLFAEGQTAMLYPPNLFFFKYLPFAAAYNLVFLAHYAIAGIGMYRFGLKKGITTEGATLAALCFTFGSAAGGNFYGLLGFRGLAWFPWTLCLAEDFIAQPKQLRSIFWLAILSGFAWLTGPQMAFYQTLFLGLYYLLSSAEAWKLPRWTDRLSRDAWFLAACALGVLIAAPQLWATMDLASHSTRASQDPDFVLWGSMAPWSLSVLFFYGWNSFLRSTLYVGIIPILLILTHTMWKKHWKLWALAILSLLLAWGRFSPLRWILLHAPVFSMLRNPSKFLFFTAFFLSLISGYALDAFIQKYEMAGRNLDFFWKKYAGFLVAVIFIGFGAWWMAHAGAPYLEKFGDWYVRHFVIGKSFHARPASDYLEMVRLTTASLKHEISFDQLSFWLPFLTLAISGIAVYFCAARKINPLFFSWLLLSLICADFFVYGSTARSISWNNIGPLQEISKVPAYLPGGKFLSVGSSRFEKLQPNENIISGTANPGIYAPLLDKDYFHLTRDFGALNDSFGPTDLKLEAFSQKRGVLDFMGVKYILADAEQDLPGFAGQAKNSKEILYTNDKALSEFCFESGGLFLKSVSTLISTPLRAELQTDEIVAGTLTRNQVFDRGWKVFVDGKAAPLKKTHTAFQGVDLAAGPHRVVFSFEPDYWIVGRWLGFLGWFLALTGLLWAAGRKERKC